MDRTTESPLPWLVVPDPAMHDQWGARQYHLRVATGILAQLTAVLIFWSVLSLTPLLFTEFTWRLFVVVYLRLALLFLQASWL